MFKAFGFTDISGYQSSISLASHSPVATADHRLAGQASTSTTGDITTRVKLQWQHFN